MKPSGTVKLSRSLLSRSIQLLRVTIRTSSIPDIYRAIGLASECLDDADKLICSLPDDVVLGSQKTFEELTGKKVRAQRKAAAA